MLIPRLLTDRARRITLVLVVVVLVVTTAIPATALFARVHDVGANTLSTTTLEAPTLDSATADSLLCQITLQWTPPTTGAAPDGYDIYRSTAPGRSYALVDHVGTATSYTDTGLAGNKRYYYVVQSTRGAWRSVDSNERSARTALFCV